MADESVITIVIQSNVANAVSGMAQVDNAADKTKKKVEDVGKTTQKSMANGTYAVTNFSRVMGDSAYFATSFSMGILSIGNNISPLVESFVQLKTATGSWKGALSSLLSSFAGPAGMIAILNIVVSGITAFSIWQSKAKTETNSNTDAINKQTEAMKKLTKESLAYIISVKEWELKDVKSKPSGWETFKAFVTGRAPKDTDANARRNQIKSEIDQLKTRQNTLGYIANIENRILVNEEKKSNLMKGQSAAYYDKMAKGATNFAMALKMINDWLKADREIINPKTGDDGLPKLKTGDFDFYEYFKNLKEQGLKYQDEREKALKFLNELNNKGIVDENLLKKKLAEDKYNEDKKLIQKLRDDGIIKYREYIDANYKNDKEYYKKLDNLYIGFQTNKAATGGKAGRVEQRMDKQRMDKLKEQYWGLDMISESIGGTLYEGMHSAFETIFGEANSMFEMIVSNFASGLADVFSRYISQSIFSWGLNLLFPGAGGLASGAIPNGAVNLTVVNQYDSQIMSKYTINNIGNNMQVARNRRLL